MSVEDLPNLLLRHICILPFLWHGSLVRDEALLIRETRQVFIFGRIKCGIGRICRWFALSVLEEQIGSSSSRQLASDEDDISLSNIIKLVILPLS